MVNGNGLGGVVWIRAGMALALAALLLGWVPGGLGTTSLRVGLAILAVLPVLRVLGFMVRAARARRPRDLAWSAAVLGALALTILVAR